MNLSTFFRISHFVCRFATFNHFVNAPIARFKDELYNLPFNMNTFHAMWGVITPQEAKEKIDEQRASARITTPSNLEEQAISLVGEDIYRKLIQGYTEKQWGCRCQDLPAFIINRLPVRFTYDNNYFSDKYQGVPEGGYTQIIEKMLDGIEVRLDTDFIEHRDTLKGIAKKIIYTGPIDEFFGYCYGSLAYRSLKFETEILDIDNFQGNAVVNYTDIDVPFTRIIEHKHFTFGTQPKTVITREYPMKWQIGEEAYYPVNDAKNTHLYERYQALANSERNIVFCGRLGSYRYLDMDQIIMAALSLEC